MNDKAENQNSQIDWGERIKGSDRPNMTTRNGIWDLALLKNAHVGLTDPETTIIRRSLVSGECLYFHYGCDGQDDRGWGCGYRTLQTLSSWLCLNRSQGSYQKLAPSLPEIQQALVTMGDKHPSFIGSREWIGTFEAALVLDHLYDVPCRILHVPGGGSELHQHFEELHHHFDTHGSPIMMGGDRDNSSKGILGVCTGAKEIHMLVLDPHYYGPPLEWAAVQHSGWVSWRSVGSLHHSSFYNLCLPQTAGKYLPVGGTVLPEAH